MTNLSNLPIILYNTKIIVTKKKYESLKLVYFFILSHMFSTKYKCNFLINV